MPIINLRKYYYPTIRKDAFVEVSGEVAAYKKANNLPIYHPEREKQVIEKVCALTKAEYREALAKIYQCIMDQSKEAQKALIEGEK